MLDVYFYSQTTNNTRAFVRRHLDYPESHVYDLRDLGYTTDKTHVVDEDNHIKKPDQPFVLLTPTYHFGEVPDPVNEFLEEYSEHLVAVASFGNKNWGKRFAKAGFLISQKYEVPLIAMIEMRGTKEQGRILGDKIRAIGFNY